MLSDEEYVIDHADWFEPGPLTVDRPTSPLGPLGHPLPQLLTADRRYVAYVEDPRVQQLRDACDE
jgi:hypothetical protein